jgi:hypothetical protein
MMALRDLFCGFRARTQLAPHISFDLAHFSPRSFFNWGYSGRRSALEIQHLIVGDARAAVCEIFRASRPN